jgi:hypothetical protein
VRGASFKNTQKACLQVENSIVFIPRYPKGEKMDTSKRVLAGIISVLFFAQTMACSQVLKILEKPEKAVSTENMWQLLCQLYDDNKRPYFVAFYDKVHDYVEVQCGNRVYVVSCGSKIRMEIFPPGYQVYRGSHRVYLSSGVKAFAWVRIYCAAEVF